MKGASQSCPAADSVSSHLQLVSQDQDGDLLKKPRPFPGKTWAAAGILAVDIADAGLGYLLMTDWGNCRVDDEPMECGQTTYMHCQNHDYKRRNTIVSPASWY